MKFLHTSDLHIGLRLCEVSLNEEIAGLLEEITEIAVREECRAVVIAGDIYDRANPTAQATRIFDDFITGLVNHGIAVLAIAGNHDSPERVDYLSRLTEERGVYFAGRFDGNIPSVKLEDTTFWLLPFVRPVQVRNAWETFEGVSYHDAMAALTSNIPTEEGCHVLVTHQFVLPSSSHEITAEKTESHALAGGIGGVGAEIFEKFAYTALGHLHRPHTVGSERVNYSGSPIKCSFSEAGDIKSVTVVETGEEVRVRRIDLHPTRDLRELKGTFDEITSPSVRGTGNPEDYLRILLTDEEDIPDAVAKLRVYYPNLMRLSYDNLRTRAMATAEMPQEEHLSPMEVFDGLYRMQNGAPLSDELKELVRELFEEAGKEADL